MDIMSSSIPSIEGYDYALVIVDDTSMSVYQWVYGLKEKSDTNLNAEARKWICDIVNIRARHVLQFSHDSESNANGLVWINGQILVSSSC